MSIVQDKIAAYISNSMEKDATSIQSIRDAAAHSIRKIRSSGASRTASKEMVKNKLEQASKLIESMQARLSKHRYDGIPKYDIPELDPNGHLFNITKGRYISNIDKMESASGTFRQLLDMKRPYSHAFADERIYRMSRGRLANIAP